MKQPEEAVTGLFAHEKFQQFRSGLRDNDSLLNLSLSRSATATDRLAAALFSVSREPHTRLMALFTAYFDASGNAQKQPYVVVSGYIANYGQWTAFNQVWEKAHEEFGVKTPFHMADFIAAKFQPGYKNQSNARTDYIELAKDTEQYEAFLKLLSQLVATTVNCGISAIVNMSIYENVSSILDLREVVPPYALGAQMCLERVRQWREYFAVHDPVECIFESGDFEQGKFTQLLIDEGQDPPIYRKKAEFPGLQAADQYAWEQYHALVDRDKFQDQMKVRESFQFILRTIPKRHTSPSLAMLVRLCERKGIDPRTGFRK